MREHPAFRLGVSPRGVLHLLHAARSLAVIRGRTWIEDQDIADLAEPVLAHRIIPADHHTDPSAILRSIAADTLRKLDRKTDWTKGSPADAPR